MTKSMTVIAALVLVLSVCTGAYAAKGLLTGDDIQNGSLTGADIKRHSLGPRVFSDSAKSSLRGPTGGAGPSGPAGTDGSDGMDGTRGIVGTNGTNGRAGVNGIIGHTGSDGADGTNGSDGSNGLAGTDGTDGTDGTNGTNGLAGTNGSNGANGVNGVNGTITPLWATGGSTALPTASPPTTVVFLDNVPAGRYVVLAKTQLSHTGAGDSIDCVLKAGGYHGRPDRDEDAAGTRGGTGIAASRHHGLLDHAAERRVRRLHRERRGQLQQPHRHADQLRPAAGVRCRRGERGRRKGGSGRARG